MSKRIVTFLFCACAFLPLSSAYAEGGMGNAAAGQFPGEIGQPRHTVQVMPYLWATGLKGDVSPFKRGPTIGVEKTFSDVMSDLNLGGFLNIWGRYDNFVISGDFMYVDSTDSRTSGPLSQLPIPVPFPPGTVLKGSLDTRQIMLALQGGYRIHDASDFTLDILAGARFWHIANDITLRAGGISRSYGERFNWVDPIVGVRTSVPLTENIFVEGAADVGGFGAGSDFTWSAIATIHYNVTDSVAIAAGYKALDVNYRKNGHVYDATLNGPVLGVTWRF